MHMNRWALMAPMLLVLGVTGCGKQDARAAVEQVDGPVASASASVSTPEQANASEAAPKADGGESLVAAGPLQETGARPGSEAGGGAYAEAIAAQRVAIGKDSSERESKELGQARANAMQKRVLKIFYAVFEDAKKSGLKLGDPMPHINSMNMGRRNSGVWELAVEAYGSDPRFVVIRDFSEVAGMFSVESVGEMSTNVNIRDSAFEKTGKFSEDCMYEISLGNQSVKYGCMAFLEGKHDKDLFAALRDMVIAEIKDAKGRRTP